MAEGETEAEVSSFGLEALSLTAESDSAESEPEVADLLLALFQASLGSSRRQLLLDPPPPDYAPDRDPTALFSALADLPISPDSRAPKLSLRLYRWIQDSNRTRLIALPKEQQLGFLGTRHQFLMVADSPEREAVFRQAKRSNGGKSVFAFHGSPIENWHSILRKGLLINGASQGVGIYMSQQASTPVAVSSNPSMAAALNCPSNCVQASGEERWLSHCKPAHLICLAICEVLETHSLRRPRPDYLVESRAENVATRFLLLYRSHREANSALAGLDLASSDVTRGLQGAVAFGESEI